MKNPSSYQQKENNDTKNKYNVKVQNKLQKQNKIINWIPLRLNNIPLVHLQANNINNNISILQKQIQKGNIQAISSLQQLFSQIKNRIFEIDRFYNNNFHDPRVTHLQNSKILLQKMVFLNNSSLQNAKYQLINYQNYHNLPLNQRQQKQNIKIKKDPINTNNNIYKNNYQKNNPQSTSKQKTNNITIRIDQQQDNNNIKLSSSKEKQKFKLKSISLSKSNNKPKSSKKLQSLIQNKNNIQIHNNHNQSSLSSKKTFSPINIANKNKTFNPTIKINKPNTNINSNLNSPTFTPISKPKTQAPKHISYQKPTSNKNSIKSNNKTEQSNNKLSNNSKGAMHNESSSTLKNLSELVFTIKMTKQEYSNFMKMKSQANQNKSKN